MTDTLQPLPSRGGSYIRDKKGNLVPARPAPDEAPRNPEVKEG